MDRSFTPDAPGELERAGHTSNVPRVQTFNPTQAIRFASADTGSQSTTRQRSRFGTLARQVDVRHAAFPPGTIPTFSVHSIGRNGLSTSGLGDNSTNYKHEDNSTESLDSSVQEAEAGVPITCDSEESSPSSDGEKSDTPQSGSGQQAPLETLPVEKSSLTYQIPEKALRAAMRASPTTGAAYWRYDLYRGPQKQRVMIHYCRTQEVAERVCQYFLTEKVLGFDIEWKPYPVKDNIKQNASLIQLASESRIALFHIALFPGDTAEALLPQSLKRILESPKILKVGVSIKADFTRLGKFFDLKARGLFELSHLHRQVKYGAVQPKDVNKKLVALKTQVEEYLQLPMQKEGKVRESDWSKALAFNQIIYAASDAYAGLRIFYILETKREQMDPVPPRPFCVELNLPIPLPAKKEVIEALESESDEVEADESEGLDEEESVRLREEAISSEPESSDSEEELVQELENLAVSPEEKESIMSAAYVEESQEYHTAEEASIASSPEAETQGGEVNPTVAAEDALSPETATGDSGANPTIVTEDALLPEAKAQVNPTVAAEADFIDPPPVGSGFPYSEQGFPPNTTRNALTGKAIGDKNRSKSS